VVYNSTAEGNEFYMNTNNYAIYAYVDLDYDYGAYNATIGDISFLDNTFYMNGTFYGDFEELTDVALNVGDVIVNGNVILNQSGDAIYMDYYDAYNDDGWYGNTTGVYGDLIICDNYIYSPSHPSYTPCGIYISYGYFYQFYDNASLTTGIVLIEGNEVTVEGGAVYFDYDYVPYDFEDNSSLRMGNVYIEDNVLNSTNSYGIEIYYYDYEIGCEMYDNASAHLSDMKCMTTLLHTFRISR